jgi:hypothetical protein
MTLAHARLDVRKIGGRIGAEISGPDGTADILPVQRGDDAAHLAPRAA